MLNKQATRHNKPNMRCENTSMGLHATVCKFKGKQTEAVEMSVQLTDEEQTLAALEFAITGQMSETCR